jgi:hypothetical protein
MYIKETLRVFGLEGSELPSVPPLAQCFFGDTLPSLLNEQQSFVQPPCQDILREPPL